MSHKSAVRFLSFGLFVLCASVNGNGCGQSSQPNIVVFLVDDMGWQDTSLPFHSEVTPLNKQFHTPNMERLAAAGMKFTQAYACSVCSPTRVSLMTGMNAARHRVTNWTLRKTQSVDSKHATLDFPDWNVNGLSPVSGIERTVHARPLPKMLSDGGYRTIHVGKAHFGAVDTPGADPLKLGFDVNIGGHAAGGPGSYLGTNNFSADFRQGDRIWDVPGLDGFHGKEIFLTEALTQRAVAEIDRAVADKQPLFLYMAHYAVHTPIEADPRFVEKYIQAGLVPIEAAYASMVEGMDKSLGDIVDRIESLNIAENTVIIFLSDNGGLSAVGRGGKKHTHNLPLNSGKGSAYEGGIRVPMLVSWPGVTRAGSQTDAPVIVEDLFPTILEISGVMMNHSEQFAADGLSFTGSLHGKSDPQLSDRPLFWHFPNNWGPTGPGIGPSSTIRQADWKLIHFYEDGHAELYNIAQDIGERIDLANEKPEKCKELSQQLGQWLKSVDAQVPINKVTGLPVPFPDT